MPEVGRIYTFPVERVEERGAWLRTDADPIFLPRRDAATAIEPGENFKVFIFRDGTGELKASLQLPIAPVGEFGMMRVREVGPHGAFLDWGVEKDLLVPFRHQPERMEVGRSYLVRVALDREGRPFGSARVENYLEGEISGVSEGDEVPLVLWQFTDLGAKVIVDHRFTGLLYRDELHPGFRVGQRLTGYIKRLREDGKIDVTLRKIGAEAVNEGREKVLAALRREGGFLPLHDGSSPEAIQSALGMSKKVFKKALGGLYKAGAVELTADGVRLKK